MKKIAEDKEQAGSDERGTPYVRSSWIETAARLLRGVGIIWVVAALAYVINGATQATAGVEIEIRPLEGSTALEDALVLPEGTSGVVVDNEAISNITLSIWDSTILEQVLARLNHLIAGLAVLAAAVLINKIMRSVAAGDPFAPGNAGRFRLLAIIVGAYAILHSIPGAVASSLALERAGLTADLAPSLNLDPFGIIVIPFGLLVLAEAFRRGGQLRADTEGLI